MKDPSSPARRPRLDVAERIPPHAKREAFWRRLTELAIIGIFIVLALAALQFSRALLLPVTLAVVIGMMMAPVVTKLAHARISPWIGSFLMVASFIGLVSLLLIELSGLVTDWAKTPDIGERLRAKLALLDRPLAALRDLQGGLSGPLGIDIGEMKIDMTTNFIAPVLSILTPAVGQLLLFVATLFFFLAIHGKFRRYLVAMSESRRDRLRALRIFNDVERNLSRYVGILTLINLGIGILTATMTAIVGLPNPAALGALAFGLNYIPLIGPAIMTTTLLVVGLLSFPSIGYALLAPAIFGSQWAIEGNFVTPSIVGRQMTMNPFAIFLAVAFWVWLWGPLGALLAMPCLIVFMVARAHFFPVSGAVLAKHDLGRR